MKKLTDILAREILPFLQKVRPENVILGEKDHAGRTGKQLELPDYQREYAQYHELPQFCFCRKGKFGMSLGNYRYLLNPYDLCVVGRNVTHYEAYIDPDQSYEVVWFVLPSVKECIALHCRYKDRRYEKLQSIHFHCPPRFIEHLDAITEKYNQWDPVKNNLSRIGTTLKKGLTKPASVYVFDRQPDDRYQNSRIRKAEAFLYEHYAEDVGLKKAAAHVGINPYYLERLFHRLTGTTVLNYLTKVRLREACRLFRTTGHTISEIAYQCGFNDLYNFSRVFKKYFGVSPRHFRNKYTL